MRMSFSDTQVLKAVAVAAALAVAAVAAPSTTGAVPGGEHGCPTPTEMVDRFRPGRAPAAPRRARPRATPAAAAR